jgi:radical SAM superfamily enzyme YgiQ (UPF0313 family)
MINKEWIQAVKAIGCSLVAIGIESGDENIRSRVHNKNITNKKIKIIVEELKGAGLMFSFYFILHAPGENWMSLLRTFKMLLSTMPTNECVSVFRPLPGTRMANDLKPDLRYLNNRRPVFLQFPNIKHPFSSSLYVGYKLYSSLVRGLQLRGLRFIGDIPQCLLRLKTQLFRLNFRGVLSDLYKATVLEYERDNHYKCKNKT